MKDTFDEYRLGGDAIENSMLAMNLAAHVFAEFGPRLTGFGMAAQQLQGFGQPARVFLGNFVTELIGTIFIDVGQIAPCQTADLDFKHAARGARQ